MFSRVPPDRGYDDDDEGYEDDRPRRRRRRRDEDDKSDADLSGLDWVLAILCSGIGCIVGIVYLTQGKPKGGKMLGISLAFVVLWNIVVFLIQSQNPRGFGP